VFSFLFGSIYPLSEAFGSVVGRIVGESGVWVAQGFAPHLSHGKAVFWDRDWTRVVVVQRRSLVCQTQILRSE
jgi:hypothetical protein